MSNLFDSLLLTSNTHPYAIGLTIFTLALFVSFTLVAASMVGLHDEYDCEDHHTGRAIAADETCPLLLDDAGAMMDPLKDYPYGRYGTCAKKQWPDRELLRSVQEADWDVFGYGTVPVDKGPRAGDKRKMGEPAVGGGKRARVERGGR